MTRLESPLIDIHRRLGAVFTDFAAWTMPVRYTSERDEHHAVRRRAGMFDLSHMGQIALEGPGAGDALDAAFVGWISKLEVGKAKYTMMCNEEGGVIDDLVVYRTDDEQFLVVANASNHSEVLVRLVAGSVGFDATVVNRSETDALIAVQGPEALGILEQVAQVELAPLKYYAILHTDIDQQPVRIARTGYTGEDGFEIYVPKPAAGTLWETLTAVGAPCGLQPAGLACRDTLRLEAGMPLYGHELDPATSPFTAGLGRIVAFDKPADFVGRKALAAIAKQRAKHTLVGLQIDGHRVPRSDHAVLARGSDDEVGRVTSGTPSPTLGHPIAMAYVDARSAAVGNELSVDIRGRSEPAKVVALPFYRRAR
jgi:aminomethyltransferase